MTFNITERAPVDATAIIFETGAGSSSLNISLINEDQLLIPGKVLVGNKINLFP